MAEGAEPCREKVKWWLQGRGFGGQDGDDSGPRLDGPNRHSESESLTWPTWICATVLAGTDLSSSIGSTCDKRTCLVWNLQPAQFQQWIQGRPCGYAVPALNMWAVSVSHHWMDGNVFRMSLYLIAWWRRRIFTYHFSGGIVSKVIYIKLAYKN